MDATGLVAFSALPLLPLLVVFWYIEHHSRRSMGFAWGRLPHYTMAVLFAIVVMGILAVISAVAGVWDLSKTNWEKAALNIALIAVSTILVAVVTEEGFFRGWLWASLEKAGQKKRRILLWTSVAFASWHLSAVLLKTGFDLPASQIPLFIINVAIIGGVWGLLRELSGSIIVSSVSHGVWNGLAYVLFGYGTKSGALGIKNTALYGPEVGLLGLVLNLCFLLLLLRLFRGTQIRNLKSEI